MLEPIGRKTLLLSLAVILAGAASAQVCTPPPFGLVAWWPADGNYSDIIGSNNGTGAGGISFGMGKVGRAFSFDGATGYVNIATSSGLANNATWTIEFWFLIHNTGSQSFVTNYAGSGSRFVIELDPEDSYGLRIGHFTNGDIDLNTSTVPLANVWHHLAAIQSANAGIGTSLYLDGALIGTGPPVEADPVVNLEFGTRGDGIFFLNGLLDEVSFYNRALTPTEIQAIYNAGSAGKCKCQASPFAFPGPTVSCVSAANPFASFVSSGTAPQAIDLEAVLSSPPATSVAADGQSAVVLVYQSSSPQSVTFTLSADGSAARLHHLFRTI